MIGMVLGDRYELLEKIGEGGMSEVYKAKDHKLNRFDAVKILKVEHSFDADIVEKFKREATAVANLSDNNIVNILDVGTQNNRHYIVMEYVKGKTLKAIIHENFRLNYEKALDVAVQIARALDCAHRNKIIHRDVKPQNILVTEEGVVKVTDFGIAKSPTSETITNTNKVMGSAHYFSPEQAKGSIVDFRTDVYSLGIVLYEMVTGKVPYDAESPVSVALKHIQDPIVPPRQLNPAVPESLNKLIVKAVEKDPNMRYQTIKEMLIDMVRIQRDVNADITFNNVEDEFTRVMDPVNPVNVKSEEADKEETVKKKGLSKRTKSTLIISLSLILVVVLGALAGWAASNRNQGKPPVSNTTVKVPQVVGKAQEVAKSEIEAAGLSFSILDSVPSDSPVGTVVETKPAAGEDTMKNSLVSVRLSSGPETFKVPLIKDYDVINAKQILIKSGFKEENISITEEYNDTVPANTVINQKPAANEKGDKNTKIQLVISKGSQFTKVPDLSGKTVVEAENILKNSNLVLDKKFEAVTNTKELDGKVILQSIAKDAEVKVNQPINITIGKYEAKKIQILDFKDKTGESYKASLLSLSSKLTITIEGNKDDKVKSVVYGDRTLKAGDSIEEDAVIKIITEPAQKTSPTPTATPSPSPSPTVTPSPKTTP